LSACFKHTRGFAAAHCGKPVAYRHTSLFIWRLRLRLRRSLSKKEDSYPESRRLSAMCCGRSRTLRLPNPSLKIPHNLRTNPFPHRHRHAIPNHPVRIVTAPRKRECIRNPLQPRILSNRIRPHTLRKPPVRNQPRAQVLAAYKAGEIATVAYEDVMAKHSRED